ncbi:hypothetical protein CTH30272_03501 [Allocatenococcus thiocycli]|nr:hypothetical protein CTH30272_03501 [Catenococcus thiocycli]
MDHVQISFQKLDEILKLSGSALLNRVILDIHQQVNTHCTCIVEVAHLQHSAHTISVARNDKIEDHLEYPLSGSPCEEVVNDIGENIFFQDHVYRDVSEDKMFREIGI